MNHPFVDEGVNSCCSWLRGNSSRGSIFVINTGFGVSQFSASSAGKCPASTCWIGCEIFAFNPIKWAYPNSQCVKSLAGFLHSSKGYRLQIQHHEATKRAANLYIYVGMFLVCGISITTTSVQDCWNGLQCSPVERQKNLHGDNRPPTLATGVSRVYWRVVI